MLRGHDGPVNVVQFSTDDAHLYSAGYDGHIRYWRVADGEYLRSVLRNGWGVNVMLADDTRNLLAYGSTDGAMVIAALDTGQDILRMGEERTPVLSVGLNSSGSQLAFGNAKGQIKIVDLTANILLRDFRAANGPIWAVLFMPQNGDMMIASLDDFITKWQIHDFPPQILDTPGPARRFSPPRKSQMGNASLRANVRSVIRWSLMGLAGPGRPYIICLAARREPYPAINIHKLCWIQISSGQKTPFTGCSRTARMW